MSCSVCGFMTCHNGCPNYPGASRKPNDSAGGSEASEPDKPAAGIDLRCSGCFRPNSELGDRIAELDLAKNGAYRERDRCVAGIAALAVMLGRRAWLGRHEGGDWDDDWRNIVFIDLPTGQVSWHIHDSELALFGFLAWDGPPWDGHDTPEKYRRLYELSTPLCAKAPR